MYKVGIRPMKTLLIIVFTTAVCSLYHELHTRHDSFDPYIDFTNHGGLVQRCLTNPNAFIRLIDHFDGGTSPAPRLKDSGPLTVKGVIRQLKGTNWKLDIDPKYNGQELFHGKDKIGALQWVEPPGFRPQYSTLSLMGGSDTFTFKPKVRDGSLEKVKWTLKPGGQLRISHLELSSDPPKNDAECPLSVIQQRSPTILYAGVFMQLALVSSDGKLKYLTENFKVYNSKDELEEVVSFRGIFVYCQGEKKAREGKGGEGKGGRNE